ncbi:MAG: sigma-70 family RNA polymerase sigma factor [Bythopirellula sp.]
MSRSDHQPTEQSYQELVTGLQSKLYAFISALMMGDAGAADVLQETNLVLWEKVSSYDRQSSFAAWGYRIAHFQVLAYRKRENRDRRLVVSDELLSTLASDFRKLDTDYGDRLAALEGCLDRLSEPQRTLIRLRYEKDQSLPVVAADIGRKVNSVATSLYRIRKALLMCIERAMNRDGAT